MTGPGAHRAKAALPQVRVQPGDFTPAGGIRSSRGVNKAAAASAWKRSDGTYIRNVLLLAVTCRYARRRPLRYAKKTPGGVVLIISSIWPLTANNLEADVSGDEFLQDSIIPGVNTPIWYRQAS